MPDPRTFDNFLRAIGELADREVEVLRVQFNAPRRLLSGRALAAALGTRVARANITYGKTARRIAELLAEGSAHDLASFGRIQRDTVSLAARGAVPVLLARTEPTAARREALDLLGTWDHDLRADSRAAAVYAAT